MEHAWSGVLRSVTRLPGYLKKLYDEEYSTWLAVLLILAAVLLYVFLRFVKKSAARRSKRHKVKLGQRPVREITDPEQILQELHYASCFCSKNTQFLDRCIALLDKLPAACNVPMPTENYTPFLRACFNGCHELMSYMLQHGADMSATTSRGDGALYLAAYSVISGKCDSLTPLKLLIAAGVDINASRKHGYTALHLAAHKGDSRVVRWLLARGAAPAPRRARLSPRQLALQNGHYSIAELLDLDTGDETPHTCSGTSLDDFD